MRKNRELMIRKQASIKHQCLDGLDYLKHLDPVDYASTATELPK
jgi:hypothetical protein